MEADIGETEALHQKLQDHEEYLENVSNLEREHIEEQTGLKIAPKLYRCVRYLEVKSLQRIRSARSEGSTMWTARQ